MGAQEDLSTEKQDIETYRKELQGYLSLLTVHGLDHASNKDLETLKVSFEQVMPLSQILEREISHDERKLRHTGHDIDKFVRFLHDKGWFRKTLMARLLSLHKDLKKIEKVAPRAAGGDPKSKIRLQELQDEVNKDALTLAASLQHGQEMFLRIKREIDAVIKTDDEWVKFIQYLEHENPEILEHTTDLQTPFYRSIQTLYKIIEAFREGANRVMSILNPFHNELEKAVRDDTDLEQVKAIIDKVTHHIIELENAVYQEYLPELYQYRKIVEGKEHVMHVEGELLKHLELVYNEIRKRASPEGAAAVEEMHTLLDTHPNETQEALDKHRQQLEMDNIQIHERRT